MLTQDRLEELHWYYGGGAERDCGMRGLHCGFEAAMKKLAKGGPRREAREAWLNGESVWLEADQPARETRSSVAASDEAHERIIDRLDKLKKVRAVYQRVRLIAEEHRAVLERNFGDTVKIQGVSVDLLCATSVVQEAVRRVNDRRMKRAMKLGEEPPEPVGARESVERMALEGSSKAEHEALAVLVAEAKAKLKAALAAYAAVCPKVKEHRTQTLASHNTP